MDTVRVSSSRQEATLDPGALISSGENKLKRSRQARLLLDDESKSSTESGLSSLRMQQEMNKMSLRRRIRSDRERKLSTLVYHTGDHERQQQRHKPAGSKMLIDFCAPSASVFGVTNNQSNGLSSFRYQPVADNILIPPQQQKLQSQKQLLNNKSQQPDKEPQSVFSIFNPKTISAVTMALAATFGTVCLLTLMLHSNVGPGMLVNAQYPSTPSAKGDTQSVKSRVYPEQTPGGKGAASSDSPRRVLAPVRHSIDRFDSGSSGGEQIRAPLLQPPTTLTPRKGSANERGGDGGNHSDQTAATSQADSTTYLSPEERQQLMRSQESHYEGKGEQHPAGQPQETSHGGDGATSFSGQQPQSAGPEARATNRKMSPAIDENEPDYDSEAPDDEGPNPIAQTGASGHENRRHLIADNALQQRQQPGPQSMSSVDAGSDDGSNEHNGDDYNSGGSDDAYFGRKSSSPVEMHQHQQQQQRTPPAQLNLAASYNQQHQQQRHANNQESDESPGFGPGPNEAYLAERAENGGYQPNQPQADPDDDGEGGADGPIEPGESEANGDLPEVNGELPARQSRQPQLQPQQQRSTAPQTDSLGVDEDSDSIGGDGLSSTNSFAISGSQPSPAPSSIRRGVENLVLPPIELSLNQPGLKQYNAAQWHKERLRQNPHLVSAASRLTEPVSGPPNADRSTQSAAVYDPQNNPSHAGKYFIN